jgi:hypothetical protein
LTLLSFKQSNGSFFEMLGYQLEALPVGGFCGVYNAFVQVLLYLPDVMTRARAAPLPKIGRPKNEVLFGTTAKFASIF